MKKHQNKSTVRREGEFIYLESSQGVYSIHINALKRWLELKDGEEETWTEDNKC